MNREEWLTQLCERHLWPLIEQHGGTRRPYRISVGFPKGSRGGRTSIGQCWNCQLSADGTFEVFVSPVLNDADAAHVALHELVHVSDALKSGHKGEFKRLATAVGLVGKMTATTAGAPLAAQLKSWMEGLGVYPHAPLKPSESAKGKGPGSRLLKLTCCDCGYTLRVTRKWLDMGTPICCCCGDFAEGSR